MSSENITVGDVFDALDDIWPFALAEEWDRVGIITGSRKSPVSNVLLTIDVTTDIVEQAIASGVDLIVAHHPLLLKGINSVDESSSKGALLSLLIRSEIALIAAHTNADAPSNGVAAVFAEKLGIEDAIPLQAGFSDSGIGIGRIGTLKPPQTLHDVAEKIAALLPSTVTGVRVAGDKNHVVHRIAVCPGAGDSLLNHPLVRSADVYVTSDLRHHPASESREETYASGIGPALIDVSHFASEWLWLETASDLLSSKLPDMTFAVSEVNTDVWDFSVAARAVRNQIEA